MGTRRGASVSFTELEFWGDCILDFNLFLIKVLTLFNRCGYRAYYCHGAYGYVCYGITNLQSEDNQEF